MKTAEQYWQEALGIIMSEVNDVIYHTFIKPIIPLRYIGNLFICTLTMDYNAYKDMIKKKYSAKIDNALTQVFGRDMKFVIESDLKENEINNENNNTYKTLRVKENGLREDFLFSGVKEQNGNGLDHQRGRRPDGKSGETVGQYRTGSAGEYRIGDRQQAGGQINQSVSYMGITRMAGNMQIGSKNKDQGCKYAGQTHASDFLIIHADQTLFLFL